MDLGCHVVSLVMQSHELASLCRSCLGLFVLFQQPRIWCIAESVVSSSCEAYNAVYEIVNNLGTPDIIRTAVKT